MESTFLFYLDYNESYVEMGFDVSERIFMLPREFVDMGIFSKMDVGDEVFIATNAGRNVQPIGTDGFVKYVYVREKYGSDGGVIYRPLYFSGFDFSRNRSV